MDTPFYNITGIFQYVTIIYNNARKSIWTVSFLFFEIGLFTWINNWLSQKIFKIPIVIVLYTRRRRKIKNSVTVNIFRVHVLHAIEFLLFFLSVLIIIRQVSRWEWSLRHAIFSCFCYSCCYKHGIIHLIICAFN